MNVKQRYFRFSRSMVPVLASITILLVVIGGCSDPTKNPTTPDPVPTARIAGTYLAHLAGDRIAEVLLTVSQSPDDDLTGTAIEIRQGKGTTGSVSGSVSERKATIVVGIGADQFTLITTNAATTGSLSGSWSQPGGRTGTWYAIRTNGPIVRLVAPADKSLVDRTLRVTFVWAVFNATAGESVRSMVATDKGQNPTDSNVEEIFDAGAATAYTVKLSKRYLDYTFQWAVCVVDARGTRACSDIRTLTGP